jgi:hypothetical protein
MQKKKGYGVMLGLTKLFTICGVAMILLSFTSIPQIQKLSVGALLCGILFPFLSAGTVCIIRKRLFTIQE